MESEQQTLSTEDYNGASINAGQIDETGVTFKLTGTKKGDGKYGEFDILVGTMDDGQIVNILYSSKKLNSLVNDNYGKLAGKRLNLSAKGVKFEREYFIRILK